MTELLGVGGHAHLWQRFAMGMADKVLHIYTQRKFHLDQLIF